MNLKTTVLIVDDNQDFCDEMSDYIKASSDMCVAAVANDGDEAYGLICAARPDVVILDIIMPKCDGISLLRKLQNTKLSKRPIIIVHSVTGNAKIVESCFKAGASHYLLKPQTCESIAYTISTLAAPGAAPAQNIQSAVAPQKEPDLETVVTDFMHELGLSAHIKGYQYVRTAIIMVLQDKDLINYITKHLYPDIARKYGSTSPQVESGIRNSIISAWEKGGARRFNNAFGCNAFEEGCKPTNSEFVAMVAEKIRSLIASGVAAEKVAQRANETQKFSEKLKTSVLIVDDNQDFCDEMSDYIKASSDMCVAAVANDGDEAYGLICMTRPDVVILDIIMPKRDGITLLKRLQNTKMTKRPLIIAHSVTGNSKVMESCYKAGAEYFLLKPQTCEAIADTIRSLTATGKVTEQIPQSVSPGQKETDLETVVTDFMHELGLPAHIKGYQYIRTAIMMVVNDMDLLNYITKQLYPDIAKKYGSTSSRVERAIRHSIEVAWTRGRPETMNNIFGIYSDLKPTNSVFIEKIAEHIRNNFTL